MLTDLIIIAAATGVCYLFGRGVERYWEYTTDRILSLKRSEMSPKMAKFWDKRVTLLD